MASASCCRRRPRLLCQLTLSAALTRLPTRELAIRRRGLAATQRTETGSRRDPTFVKPPAAAVRLSPCPVDGLPSPYPPPRRVRGCRAVQQLRQVCTYDTPWAGAHVRTVVWSGVVDGLPVYFVEPSNGFFWRGRFYGEADDLQRFLFFSR